MGIISTTPAKTGIKVLPIHYFAQILRNGILKKRPFSVRHYFKLRKPLERRLYEIARKHVGRQGVWIINIESLHRKSGSRSVLRNFKVDLNKIIAADSIPEYRYFVDDKGKVTVYAKDPKQIHISPKTSR